MRSFLSLSATTIRPQDSGGVFLVEVSAKPGDLERSDTFLVVMYRATALTTVTRWPVIFCQLFGQEGTQDLKSNRGEYNWKMSKC